MKALSLAIAATLLALPAVAQPYAGVSRGGAPGSIPGPYGFIVGGTNNTGGVKNLIMPRGATGADTVFTNSAVGGNAGRPELAVPNGSAGGSPGSR
ncbi:hypothetical protein Q8W71_21530 [Methylobacterium sp. NEAU 140]|uniref:hypothetical protein n=1 Tax=Methylobacterium sp. NEAU 140 TaxID=3064945 RepID=UPI002732F45A|nr:hypothetical protein [Methylobacterium sp. NEAU 140]MDP4025215.1 hypothetical protein [Methylobacterium sp. NEAU 140]